MDFKQRLQRATERGHQARDAEAAALEPEFVHSRHKSIHSPNEEKEPATSEPVAEESSAEEDEADSEEGGDE